MKTTSLASTVSRIRFAIVVLPEPVPPEMPIIKLIPVFIAYSSGSSPPEASVPSDIESSRRVAVAPYRGVALPPYMR